MAMLMEVHVGGVIGHIPAAHQTALEGPGSQVVRYVRYWAGRAREVFCLVQAPSREAVEAFCGRGQESEADHIVELPGFVA